MEPTPNNIESQRVLQLKTNIDWLLQQIDAIHDALCPEQNGTWQMRVEQAVKAARQKKPLPDDLAGYQKELEAIKRVLALVDGYISTQNQDKLLAYNGGVMTWAELRNHLQTSIKLKVLNS